MLYGFLHGSPENGKAEEFALSSCPKQFQQRGVGCHPCRVSGLPAVPGKAHLRSHSAPWDDAGRHPVGLEKGNFAGVPGSGGCGPFHCADNAAWRVNSYAQAQRRVTLIGIDPGTDSLCFREFLEAEIRKHVKKRSGELSEF